MSLGIQRWDFCPHGCKMAAAHPSMESVSLEEEGKVKGQRLK